MRKNVSLSLPKPAQFALVAVGALVVLLVGWMALLGPKQKQISDMKTQAALVQQQIADDLARASTVRGASSTPTIKVADFYKLQTAMPSTADMPDLLLELDQQAKAAGVSIQSIAPSTTATAAAPGTAYTPLDVTLAVSGNFYALTDLLYRLRNLVYVRNGALEPNGRIFAVNSVSMTPGQREITAQVALTTYVYSGGSSSTSTAPTGTTTTTTTATTTSSTGPSAAGATP